MNYRIRVAGRLGAEWSERTNRMAVTVHPNPEGRTETELTGPISDDAALMGILEQLYTHGAQLLVVECIDGDNADAGALGQRMALNE